MPNWTVDEEKRFAPDWSQIGVVVAEATTPKVLWWRNGSLPAAAPPHVEPLPDTTPVAEIWRHCVEPLPAPEMTRLVVEATPVLSIWKSDDVA